jgi:hypothetical protein
VEEREIGAVSYSQHLKEVQYPQKKLRWQLKLHHF